VSRLGLNLTELAQLSLAIARGHSSANEPTHEQIDRVLEWADTTKADAETLKHVFEGDLAISIPDVDEEADNAFDFKFTLTAKGHAKVKAQVDATIERFKQHVKATTQRVPAETKPEAPSSDLTAVLRSLLDGLFGKQTPESIKADAERNAKVGGK